MRTQQRLWSPARGWSDAGPGLDADLVLVFGTRDALEEPARTRELKATYPRARLFGCSTAGEILGAEVTDGCIAATAVKMDRTRLAHAQVAMDACASSEEAGARLARALPAEGLVHVLVLSDGQRVNGSELARGMVGGLPPGVAVTGGLAGDGAGFRKTLVYADDAPREGYVAAVGFYGAALRVSYGSLGGWDSFGVQRTVTRARGNVLYELDGQPALALYKRYLGEHAAGLPSTGLLFPLSVQAPGAQGELVRTILSVNEADQSLTFAGDVPEGSVARLMKANFDRLIDGAQGAARASAEGLGRSPAELAILISCVGRKLVLKQRTEDELEAVRSAIGPAAAMTGLYSYGEICPSSPLASCELHNQTMTITAMREA